ncbi:hypothetical protein QBC40DRAFT_198550 [Triangularia verruculosa]|uniref:Uncharacterized protein n=1 Tax=Triangularia verruculosa TaxID=2587418 RepID=A0AAN6XID5_9PEZI|nr:hypothetical protein QBC40DRAFT_198550 [Triangularia verruculosa]
MAEVVGLVVAANSLAKTCSTVYKLAELMIEISTEAPEVVEEEIRSYRLLLKTCFTAIQSARISLKERWPRDESSCTAAMNYLRKNRFLDGINRLAKGIKRKVLELMDRTARLPSSLQLKVNYRWHRLKPDFIALLPFMETLKSNLVLAQSTLKLESFYERRSWEERRLEGIGASAKAKPTEEMTLIMTEIVPGKSREIKHDMSQVVDMIHDLQVRRSSGFTTSGDLEDRHMFNQNVVLAFLADEMIKRGVVPNTAPPPDYKIPKNLDVHSGHRSWRPSYHGNHKKQQSYGKVSPHSSQPSSPTSNGSTEMSTSSPSSSQQSPPTSTPGTPGSSKETPVQFVSERPSPHVADFSITQEAQKPPENSGLTMPKGPPRRMATETATATAQSEVDDTENTLLWSGVDGPRIFFDVSSPHTQIVAARHRFKPISGHVNYKATRHSLNAHLHPSKDINIISLATISRLGLQVDGTATVESLNTGYGVDGGAQVIGTIEVCFHVDSFVSLEGFSFKVCERLQDGYDMVLGVETQQWLMRKSEHPNYGLNRKKKSVVGGEGSARVSGNGDTGALKEEPLNLPVRRRAMAEDDAGIDS